MGHIYVGQTRFGVVALGVSFVLRLLQAFVTTENFAQLATMTGIAVFWQLTVPVHAAVRASRTGAVQLRWYNTWYVYPLIILASSAALVLLKPYQRFNAYRIPSSAMEPTLLSGDYLFVDSWWYRARPVERGDIIVFESPTNARIFIKRCVAVAGDTLEIRSKKLWVNGAEQVEPYAVHRSPQLQLRHDVSGDFMPRRVVPPGHVFVLGDNRDNSSDSRFWGALPIGRVQGKATFIYLSIDVEHSLFPPRLRRERIGRDLSATASARHGSADVN